MDGIPLAIEFAAARVSMLQASKILDQLKSSFALLSTDNRTGSIGQQTLQASMDWSWAFVKRKAEQTFMRQLSKFAGGWTLELAEACCDGAFELSETLVKKSLIMVDQRSWAYHTLSFS